MSNLFTLFFVLYQGIHGNSKLANSISAKLVEIRYLVEEKLKFLLLLISQFGTEFAGFQDVNIMVGSAFLMYFW